MVNNYLHNEDNIKLQSSIVKGLYGSFPGTVWNGGRVIDMYKIDYDIISYYISLLNENNIKCRLTFTNSLLDKTHLQDIYCNTILDIIDNGFGNEIITYSPILEEYLHTTHPNLGLVSSITKGHDLETFKSAIQSNKYNMVVAYPKQNILNYIKDLSIEKQQQVEILLNSGCSHCPIMQQHYRTISQDNLEQTFTNFDCYRNKQYNVIISENEALNYDFSFLSKLNIQNYKIQGRCESLDEVIYNIINNLFIDESIYQELLNQISRRQSEWIIQ